MKVLICLQTSRGNSESESETILKTSRCDIQIKLKVKNVLFSEFFLDPKF